MEGRELEDWVTRQRSRVIGFLENEGIDDPQVGEWPAFEVAPCFAIWAVESEQISGKIGWWAFSGDGPTDYVTEDGSCHPREALKRLLDQWRGYVSRMSEGKQPVGVRFPEEADLKHLAHLLDLRINVLAEWIDDDGLWEDR